VNHPYTGASNSRACCTFALVTPEAREAHGGAQFPGFCLLLTGHGERSIKIALRFHCIRLHRFKRDFARDPIYLGLNQQAG
jgi:hypothetical protein